MKNRISYTVTSQTMGDSATQGDAEKWATHVAKRLHDEYPQCEVAVIVNCRLSGDILQTHGVELETVGEFIGMLWDRELDQVFP